MPTPLGEDIEDGGGLWALWTEHKAAILTMALLVLLAVLLYIMWRRTAPEAMSAAQELSEVATHTLGDQRLDAAESQHRLDAEMLRVLVRSEADRAERDLLLHLAISLIVAVWVILIVELRSASRRRQDMRQHRAVIAESVWQAVVHRMVPEEVVREMDKILKARSIRKDCRYTITFKLPYPGMPADFLVVERKVVYTLVNTTRMTQDVPIRAIISPVHADVKGRISETSGDARIARHIEMKVGGRAVVIDKVVMRDPLALHHVEQLKGGEEVEVFLRSEEAVQTRDHYAVFLVAPSCGVSLRIDDSAVKDKICLEEVLLNSTSRDDDFKPSDDGVRKHVGALLPGQGFRLRWRENAKGASM